MNAVFADTFYFLALLNPRDAAHARAVDCAVKLVGELNTSAWVLTELADGMSRPGNRQEFVSLLSDLRANSRVRIVGPEESSFEEGVRLYGARSDKEWSLTDCISFCIMRRDGIADALTGDHHFEQAGFRALLK